MRTLARVYQGGTQRRSVPKFLYAADVARSGRLGRLQTVYGYTPAFVPNIGAFWARQPEPKGGKAQPKAKTDLELIQGTWQIVKLESNGKEEPKTNYQGNSVTMNATFNVLAAGLSYMNFADVQIPAKQMDVQVSNFNYNRNN